MKVLISTSIFAASSSEPLDLLNANNFEAVLNPYRRKLSSEELLDLGSDVSAVVAGTEEYNDDTLKHLPKLKLISRVGVGIDNLNLEDLKKRNIEFRTSNSLLADSVSELVIGLTIDICRNISSSSNRMKNGFWDKQLGQLVKGKKVGIGFNVSKFVEKPSIELAQEYINSEDYYWNSGMFLVKSSVYLSELLKFSPKIYEICQLVVNKVESDLDFIRINKEKFLECPSKSIDYAIMEKTNNAVVVPMNTGWSDIGSWSSLWDLCEKDSNGNAIHGDVVIHNSRNSYFRTDGILVAAIGVDDLVLVATKDVIMVAHKDNVQNVKIITKALEADDRSEWALNREVYRPWGKFDAIDTGDRYQVKRITVKSGAKLSLQMHHHRSEHWVVVSGTARVTNGDKTFLLSENESTYIPIGVVHALENPGKVELELIEIQSGRYLGEDDIVRFEDLYGR